MNIKPGDRIEVRVMGIIEEVTEDTHGKRFKIVMDKKNPFGFNQYVVCEEANLWTAQNEVDDVKTPILYGSEAQE